VEDRFIGHIETDTALLPLIGRDAEPCRGCMACVRVCPTGAIRIVDGVGEVVQERCIACGACVVRCGNAGMFVRDDTPAVQKLLDSSRSTVILLATEFVAALHPLSSGDVEYALEKIGFAAVECSLLGEEMVARAYEDICSHDNGIPMIRSTCPVVVSWVRKYRPALAGALAPIVPPYIAQARLIKRLYPDDVAVVYAGPCFARKDEALSDDFGGAIDVAIDFRELRRMLDGTEVDESSSSHSGVRRPEPLKELSLTDGFPRRTMAAKALTSNEVQVVRGIRELDVLLGAIESGEAAPSIVDALCCDGCIDGPAVDSGRSVFSKRNLEMTDREQRRKTAFNTQELLRFLPGIDLVRVFEAAPVETDVPNDARVLEILAQAGLSDAADRIDCGACGCATCVDHAIAIHRGISSWEMCFPFERRRLDADLERLTESATKDVLTGLWNRTVLQEKLSDEMSRFTRYGTPMSLLMIDLDGFKRINDERGHLVGDQILCAVGTLLRDSMRISDIAVRYGGDEFAVVLPGATKTDAFAVAEKLRATISSLRVSVDGDGYLPRVGTTASIGVASAARSVSEPVALIEAADSALYSAKELGRNQVRIAPE